VQEHRQADQAGDVRPLARAIVEAVDVDLLDSLPGDFDRLRHLGQKGAIAVLGGRAAADRNAG